MSKSKSYFLQHNSTLPVRRDNEIQLSTLPLPTPQKSQKINVIRREIDQKRFQIIHTRSKMHSLEQLKHKFDHEKKKSLQKYEQIQSVRARITHDQQQKQKKYLQRTMETQYLKERAAKLRECLEKEKSKNKEYLSMQKAYEAQKIREETKEAIQMIAEAKNKEVEKAKEKAQEVKKEEFEHSKWLFEHIEEKKIQARRNHEYRIEDTLKRKKKTDRTLKKLLRKEEKLRQQVQHSQLDMLKVKQDFEEQNPQFSRTRMLYFQR